MCISSLVRCLFKSFAHFFNQIVHFVYFLFIVEFQEVSGVFWMTVLSQRRPLQILSPRLWLVFSFARQCFSQADVFNCNEVQLIVFLSWIVPLVLYVKCHRQAQGHLDILLFCLRRVLFSVCSVHFKDCIWLLKLSTHSSLPSHLFFFF